AAAVEIAAMARRVGLRGVYVTVRDFFPESLWLKWKHAGAAELLDQQPPGGPRVVAHHFRPQPKSRAPRQPPALWIALAQFRCHTRGLAVCRRSHHQPLHGLDIPLCPNELGGQPVEQLWVAGRIALGAEILGGFNNSRAEMQLPIAINRHARRERMPWIDQPFR